MTPLKHEAPNTPRFDTMMIYAVPDAALNVYLAFGKQFLDACHHKDDSCTNQA